MYVSIHKIVFLTVFCLSTISLSVHAEGVFQLRLQQFVNNEGLDAAGSCCVSSSHDKARCIQPCQTAFRVCLKHFQRSVNPEPPCYYGSLETPVIGTNSFLPMAVGFFGNKPIQFHFNFSWPESFSLIVDVLHKNNPNEKEMYNGDQTDVLISRLVKSGLELPAKNKLSSWTTPKPYRHRKTKLEYSYRVLCLKNTYGPGCSIYCRPRNDGLGHYRCDRNGQKVCLAGWTGSNEDSYCTKAICQDGCFHGTCDRPNVCRCNLGWSGKDCSQCMTRDGCMHGSCTRPYECKCKIGWGGHYCNQDLNSCTNNNPCLNGALCSNTGEGSYTCTCPHGYIGRNCHLKVDACVNQPCKNNRNCANLSEEEQCICSKLLGQSCKKSVHIKCSDSPCQHGGVCVEGDDYDLCQCPVDWTGVSCEKPANHCLEAPCKNGGVCAVVSNGFKCSCKSGFSGTVCENTVKSCSEHPCLNGGICLDPLNVRPPCHCRKCQCLLPYAGDRCQYRSTFTTTSIPPVKTSTKVNNQKGRLISARHEHKGDGSYFIRQNDETKFIVVSDQNHSLNTTHWMAICFSSVILVLSLLLATGCLIYHRKNISLSKRKNSLRHSSVCEQQTHTMQFPVTTNRCSEAVTTMKDTWSQNCGMQPMYSEATSFLEQQSQKAGSKDDQPISKMQLNLKNDFAANNRPARHFSSQYPRQNIEINVLRESTEVASTTQQLDEVTSAPTATGLQLTAYSENMPFLEHLSIQDRSSSMRPPTYEEVCEENN